MISKIYNNLGKSISRKDVEKIVFALIKHMSKTLLEDYTPISIKNFGTFSPYILSGHVGFNVQRGKLVRTQDYQTVKFNPHYSFLKTLRLLRHRKFTANPSDYGQLAANKEKNRG